MAAPVVTNVTATNTNGTYRPGTVISATVTFDQAVDVTGTPQLLLDFAPTDRQANYASGTGTATIMLTYTTVAGDAALDLDYVAVGSLTLNGGTIQNAGLENATLTLPAPGAAGSIGANKQLNFGIVYTVGFKNAGVPATALTPTITTPVLASTGAAYSGATTVAELAGGSYKFAADPSEAVFLGVDGGAGLANADRYVQMVIGPQDAYLDAAVSSRLAPTVASRTLDVSATGEADANVATWLGSAPAALTASGYVQSILLRWLTDNAGGTPNALASGNVSALANAITNGIIAAATFAANAVDANALAADAANEVADALLDRTNGVETGRTLRDAIRRIASVVAGNASGGPGNSDFKALGNSGTSRVQSVADATGNRTVTLP